MSKGFKLLIIKWLSTKMSLHVFIPALLWILVPTVCVGAWNFFFVFMYKPWQVSSSTWTKLSERRKRLVLAVKSPSETASEARSKEFYVLLQSSFLWSWAVSSAPKGFLKHLPNRYDDTRARVNNRPTEGKLLKCLLHVRKLRSSLHYRSAC